MHQNRQNYQYIVHIERFWTIFGKLALLRIGGQRWEFPPQRIFPPVPTLLILKNSKATLNSVKLLCTRVPRTRPTNTVVGVHQYTYQYRRTIIILYKICKFFLFSCITNSFPFVYLYNGIVYHPKK